MIDTPSHLESALELVRCALEDAQPRSDSPFSNTAATFSTPTFEVAAYSWTDEDQLYNFKWKDVEVTWYKHFGRSMKASRDVSVDECLVLVSECVAAIKGHFATACAPAS